MSTPPVTTLHARLEDLFSCIRKGRLVEAINEFYADDAVMQEHTQLPTVGREANME